ncbi:MAG TPA: cell division protein ZapB [Thermoanaerobaculia bacterium]|nr:cell division protein ZapB [Thermoanaerobaculia bacterium]
MKKSTKATEEPGMFPESREEDLLEKLSGRVERAVESIQKLRTERDALRARLDEVGSQLAASGAGAGELAAVREELDRYRGEREQIRTRITTILASLEALDEE